MRTLVRTANVVDDIVHQLKGADNCCVTSVVRVLRCMHRELRNQPAKRCRSGVLDICDRLAGCSLVGLPESVVAAVCNAQFCSIPHRGGLGVRTLRPFCAIRRTKRIKLPLRLKLRSPRPYSVAGSFVVALELAIARTPICNAATAPPGLVPARRRLGLTVPRNTSSPSPVGSATPLPRNRPGRS
jgi:hypothetical protein